MDLPIPSLSVRRLAALTVGVAAALLLLLRHLGGGGGTAAPAVAPLRAATRPPAAALVVDVAGAVRRPGLYHLRDGMRIADAIAAAGGATAKAQTDLVDLAAPVADGEQVVVPQQVETGADGGAPAASSPTAGPSPTAPLDLNTATAAQLDALPGVGPSTAQKIVDYRQAHGPFHSVDELDGVSGIGPAKLAELKGLVIP